jgi:hypothetical protein
MECFCDYDSLTFLLYRIEHWCQFMVDPTGVAPVYDTVRESFVTTTGPTEFFIN